MPSVPVPADPGWDDDPARPDRDPIKAAEREAWLDWLCAQDDDPFDQPEEEYWDPADSAPPPGQDELTGQELAGVREAAADEMLALDAASTGRRGPGQAGSARTFPGESASRAAGFGTGMAWDVTPGCAQLAVAADAAVDGGGPADSFGGVADHELVGLVCAWDRLEAHAAARKLAAVAEVFRRNPEDGFEPEPRQMPAVVYEFTRDQLALALGESRAAADWLLTVAWHLATRLAATLGALADGGITRGKAELIVRLTRYLSDGEARAVEAKILGRAGRLTPGGLRSATARAVMEAAPGKARQRRETAAKFARVERWAEDSGNAALMGGELPPTRRSGSLYGDDPAPPPPSRDKGKLRREPGSRRKGDIESVLAQARTAASGRDVVLIGGASLGRQFVKAGLVDDMRIHLVHLLLGTGARLFDLAGDEPWPLQTTRLVEDAGVTHFHFLVPTSPRPRG